MNNLKKHIVLITSTTPRLALATDSVNGYVIAEEGSRSWSIIDRASTKERALEIIDELTKTSN